MLNEKKNCPFCGEEILSVAIKCKHCHTMLRETESNKSSPVFTTNKIYLETLGGSGPGVPGTLTMFSDRLSFIPGGFRLAKGRDIFINYGDILSIKRPISLLGRVEIKTKQGETVSFISSNAWDKGDIEKFCTVIRSNS